MSPSSSSSTPPSDRFAVHEGSPVLSEDLREPLVRYARRRIRRAGELAPPHPSSAVDDPLADSVRTCSTLGLDDSRRSTASSVAVLSHADVDLGECLGYGSFSSCYAVKAVRGLDDSYRSQGRDDQDGFDESIRSKATSTASADSVVVKVLRGKVMDSAKMFAACAGDLVKEGRFLASLNHANVVAVRAASSEDGVSAYGAVGRHDAYFLVLDRLEETLAGRIVGWKEEESIQRASSRRRGSLDLLGRRRRAARQAVKMESLSDRRRALLELADALSYVHSRGMVHRDVKPDNIGFDRSGALKLFDFDVARVLPTAVVEEVEDGEDEDGVPPPPPPLVDPYGEVHKMTKRVGSPRYMAPECALGRRYNARVDVYSYGLVAHEVLTLVKPYDDVHSDDHDEAVFVEGVRPRVPRSWTPALASTIEGCWSHDPEERPTMEAAKSDLGFALDAYAASMTGELPSSSSKNTANAAAPSKSKSVAGVERGGPRQRLLGRGASWSRRMARRVSAQ